ncbi:PREDICTED: DNA fragmentation factor subunit beta isoform X2 [Thamnophis sirtalis]|uniref:DNAation factor subunit beta isoform X2 n=1 Tax=Thamnophis sirtalis TaxID=35019 RepID=A0A6I9XRP1_9SAUR|nr:PREDICTED: DNA fragmentation factor subunit beta isoform X2 [Thamnophis sirtalis]
MAAKAFKVRAGPAGRRYGLAAGSLAELLRKASRLEPPLVEGCRLGCYEDGRQVSEEAFRALPENSELILLRPGEEWSGYVSEIERFLSAFSSCSPGVVHAAQGLLSGEEAPMRCKLLSDLIQNLSENISAESRKEDEMWFEVKFSGIAEAMLEKLKSEKYNGFYFDRKEETKDRLCTPEGWFSCQGPFDSEDCSWRHSINPYGNKESRILFSTWNLDHIIEKKRAVLPTLVEAVKGCDGKEIDWEYFYRLMFTTDNLKLVHIVCHKKTVHNLGCDRTKIYRKRKTGRKTRPLCGHNLSPRVQLSKTKQKNDTKLSKNKATKKPHPIAKKGSA